MSDFVKTVQAEEAIALCCAVQSARPDERMGQITGEPGTGKSALTKWLAEELGGVRIECWAGMNDKRLMVTIAEAISSYDQPVDLTGTSDTLFHRLKEVCGGRLILIDEANHLHWPRLEKLRALSDLAGAAVVLCGTDLLSRRLRDTRIDQYVKQLRSRIGAKRIVMNEIRDDAEFAAYILAPRFGSVSKRLTRHFRETTDGNWRMALGLADACARLMENEGLPNLTDEIVTTAAAWMAGRN